MPLLLLTNHPFASQAYSHGKLLIDSICSKQKKHFLGAGCFWCVEAIFQRLRGVQKTISGYAGGDIPQPDYRLVCSGSSGHAEVCQISFDPQKIPYKSILDVFWDTHDPTHIEPSGSR